MDTFRRTDSQRLLQTNNFTNTSENTHSTNGLFTDIDTNSFIYIYSVITSIIIVLC